MFRDPICANIFLVPLARSHLVYLLRNVLQDARALVLTVQLFVRWKKLLFDENETAESVKPADHFALQDSNISTTWRKDLSKCY